MLHTVAKLHYEAEMSQVDIARRLGVSTATISRLLQRARAEGIVRIEVLDIVTPEAVTAQLIEGLGLRDAAVVETPAVGVLTALQHRWAACSGKRSFRPARWSPSAGGAPSVR
ncbi:hypothetical protein AJ88_03010 [Mesorhizobium amorphae CCBAU 01583]|nr:hypothetical protein AJ88_03010 [Mesorhizobium amorphae CCBAU 01583]